MEKIGKSTGFIPLLDQFAGGNVSDAVLGHYRLFCGGGLDAFEALPMEEIIGIAYDAMNDTMLKFCAAQNRISVEEQRGRFESAVLAFKMARNGQRVFFG